MSELSESKELELRRLLWAGHGHLGLYGDDGQLQCGKCQPFYDYRHAPLEEIVQKALTALTTENQRLRTALAAIEPIAEEGCWCDLGAEAFEEITKIIKAASTPGV
jgi:hypothetical protein